MLVSPKIREFSAVITSYSIHYTKLYEARTSFPCTVRKRENPKAAPFSSTRATRVCRVSRSSNRTGDRYRHWVAITGNPVLRAIV